MCTTDLYTSTSNMSRLTLPHPTPFPLPPLPNPYLQLLRTQPLCHMGSILCCLGGQAACCAGSTLLSCCCSAATKASARCSKAAYMMLVMVSAMLALGLRYYGVSIEEKINSLPVNTTSYMPHIVGDEAVYRISFVLCLFFLTMLGLTLCSNKFHNGFWGVKLAIYVLAIGGSIFIPDYVFNNNG